GPPLCGGPPRPRRGDGIRDSGPAPPRRHNPDIDPELEHICLRCLCKAPQQRYASAHELAEKLRAFTRARQYMRNYTTLGMWLLALAPVGLVIDLVVWWMLQGSFWEPVVWLLISSHYLKLSPT